MQALTANLPEVAGTIPQWGMFVALMAILIKQILPWRQMTITREENLCSAYKSEVTQLRKELKECEVSCAEKSKALQEELYGMRRQHIQEQISLINTIMRSVDAPELRTMIQLLERVQQNLMLTRHIDQEHKDDVKRS